MSKFIIDISHHQDPSRINYDKLAAQLYLAIVRTQYGSMTVDRHYKTHHNELRKRGVPTNAYAWVRGTSIADMEVEATDFYNRTKEFAPEVWWLDVEEQSMTDMRAGVSAYVKKLRQLGAKKVGAYIGHHLYKKFNLNISEFDAIWIPHYGRNTGKVDSKPSYSCDIHQYTSVGKLDGYSGNLDLNRILSGKKLEFFVGKKEAPKPKPQPKQDADAYMHVVKSGDTLSEIAAKYGLTVDYLVRLNQIENKNLIYVGQRIKLKGTAPESKTQNVYHTVKSGDTLSEIAKKYNTSVSQLVAWNKIKNPNLIYPGQKFRVK